MSNSEIFAKAGAARQRQPIITLVQELDKAFGRVSSDQDCGMDGSFRMNSQGIWVMGFHPVERNPGVTETIGIYYGNAVYCGGAHYHLSVEAGGKTLSILANFIPFPECGPVNINQITLQSPQTGEETTITNPDCSQIIKMIAAFGAAHPEAGMPEKPELKALSEADLSARLTHLRHNLVP